MEIERKWIVGGWPADRFPVIREQTMRQGYLTVRPTVRIREEIAADGKTDYILCFKKGYGLIRQEIEIPLSSADFQKLEEMIGAPLIPKIRRTYLLPDGSFLEVNQVDAGQKDEFWYAEIEFPSEAAARSFNPSSVGLGAYLSEDVTEVPGQSMGEFWLRTRSESIGI
jgi:CYTH domain-containing protein